MKKISWLTLLLLMHVTILLAYNSNPYPPVKIKGGFKHLSLYEYGTNDKGLDVSNKILKFDAHYDNNGRLVEQRYQNINDMTCNPMGFKVVYDESGKVASETYFNLVDTTRRTTIKYTYNAVGQVIEQFLERNHESTRYFRSDKLDSILTFSSGNSISSKKYYSYHPSGYQSDEIKISSKGWQYYTQTEKFDTNGNLLQHIEYNSDGTIYWTTYYSYNTNNKQIEERSYDVNGYSTSRHTYKYDAQGNEIERISYHPDKSVDSFTSLYNLRRRKQTSVWYYPKVPNDLKEEWNSYNFQWNNYNFQWNSYNPKNTDRKFRRGTVESKRVYRYDKSGVILEVSVFDGQDSLESRTLYNYDMYGNCIDYVEYDASNKPLRKTEFVYTR